MSNAPSTLDPRPVTGTAREPTTDFPTLVRAVGKTLHRQFQFAGFWSAILLPVIYVPMLVSGAVAARPSAFVTLLAVHAAALVAGHDYHDE